ncbi:putative ribonuclease H-like domain-containing protein [Tanacetum coccineum]
MVLLRVPKKHNLYTINLNNLSPKGNLACLVAKASVDESVKVRFFMVELIRKYMSLSLRDLWILNIPRRSTRRGTIDKTLFLKKHKRDIILVQVYVDDIIFGSTKKAWCDEFEALRKGEFEMSAMGEITFFLGLQVQQRPDGMFISQDKSMIGSLMYLTASRPDIMFAVSACSRNQVAPTTSNLEAMKKILNDYAKANKDRKSTTGRCQFLGRRLISWQCKKQTIVATSSTEAEYVAAANCCGQKLIQVLKIHTDDNVADLLTKAFDGPRFTHLVVNIGMLNP